MSFQAIFKNTRLWTFICGLFLFSSCRYSKTPEVFEDKNISIEYPSYLFKAEDVYPEKNTLLQLKNDYRDVYFILVDHGMKPGVSQQRNTAKCRPRVYLAFSNAMQNRR